MEQDLIPIVKDLFTFDFRALLEDRESVFKRDRQRIEAFLRAIQNRNVTYLHALLSGEHVASVEALLGEARRFNLAAWELVRRWLRRVEDVSRNPFAKWNPFQRFDPFKGEREATRQFVREWFPEGELLELMG